MPRVAHLEPDQRAAVTPRIRPRRKPKTQTTYFAFLSYSHQDEELAKWLQRKLEQFQVPSSLVGRLTPNGAIPRRLTPVFRDEHELAAADDLGAEIEAALDSSQCLIVLCSPTAARSKWVNAEIATFKRVRPDGCVLAAVAAGEPFASDLPGREGEECFPPALRYRFDRRGHQTLKRVEPLAADLRHDGEGRKTGFLKLVAGMLGISLDELVRREATQRHRRMLWTTVASVLGMVVAIALAVAAVQARDEAREQRREAEGLVAYMLGDLKDKLEPIGRLDALDGVGSRVLAYYSSQDAAELSDAALLQRSRALSLTAEVSYLRGNLDTAERLYRQALEGTGEAVRRDPDDPQRLFDHAQNIFAIGKIARDRGDRAAVEGTARQYKALATKMVALDTNNMTWRMEEMNAAVNLGVALFGQRRFSEAGKQFREALTTIEALATANPRNGDYQQSLAQTLAWLADARMAEGQLHEAIAHRERHVALLERLLAGSGEDVAFRQMLVPAYRGLGNALAARGQLRPAIEQLRKAVAQAQALMGTDRSNLQWQGLAARARLNLAEMLVAANQSVPAESEAVQGCAILRDLVARDPTVHEWRAGLRDCHMIQARIALRSGKTGEALEHARTGLENARAIKSGDAIADRYAVARAYRIMGDVQAQAGNQGAARSAWMSSLSSMPQNVPERPSEISEHALVLDRLGRRAEAQRLTAKLDQIGYKRIA